MLPSVNPYITCLYCRFSVMKIKHWQTLLIYVIFKLVTFINYSMIWKLKSKVELLKSLSLKTRLDRVCLLLKSSQEHIYFLLHFLPFISGQKVINKIGLHLSKIIKIKDFLKSLVFSKKYFHKLFKKIRINDHS